MENTTTITATETTTTTFAKEQIMENTTTINGIDNLEFIDSIPYSNYASYETINSISYIEGYTSPYNIKPIEELEYHRISRMMSIPEIWEENTGRNFSEIKNDVVAYYTQDLGYMYVVEFYTEKDMINIYNNNQNIVSNIEKDLIIVHLFEERIAMKNIRTEETSRYTDISYNVIKDIWTISVYEVPFGVYDWQKKISDIEIDRDTINKLSL